MSQQLRRRRAGLVGAFVLGLLAAVAGDGGRAAAGPGPVRQEVALGPVRVTLEADRRTMPIDGRLQLSLRVEAPAGTVVTLPEVADKLGPFVVASQTAAAPSSAGADGGRWRRDYVLEAEATGELALPPLTVAFRAPADAEPRQLATAPLAITVTSLLPADVDLTAYKDIAPPVELPRPALSRLVWPVGLLALGLAGLALLVWRRRRRSRLALPPSQPAHLLALAELERLERQLPADRPGTEEFYVRLAAILRHYVALRFGLSAPTQTTEELLAAADRTGGSLTARRPLIGRLLAGCDLVKFARQRPPPDTAPDNLRHARTFVEQTADPQAVAGPSGGFLRPVTTAGKTRRPHTCTCSPTNRQGSCRTTSSFRAPL